MFFDYDPQSSPLDIKTDSVIGSDEKVYVLFRTAQGDSSGSVVIYFSSPPQYYFPYCTSSDTNFPTSIPSAPDKIWRITLSRNAGVPRVVIHCNEEEVLNILISRTTCTNPSRYSRWTRQVEKIEFSSSDTASDYHNIPGN